MIDLERAHALQHVGPAVGEGVEAGADDHILADASDGRTLDDVLRQATANADPPDALACVLLALATKAGPAAHTRPCAFPHPAKVEMKGTGLEPVTPAC